MSPVPSGAWTRLRWIAIPGGHSPVVPAPPPGWGTGVTLAGFSKGYLEFMWNAHKRTLIPWISVDGLTWKAGASFDLSIWAASFKDYDSHNDGSDPNWHDECAVVLDNFQEDLDSLLLVDHVVCSDGKCGFSSMTEVTTWISPDALSWTMATIPSTVDPILISGGSSGFIALGSAGSTATVWISPDGHTWTPGALPAAALAAGAHVSDPVSFAGGFVLPGVVRLKSGHRAGSDEGCVGDVTDLSKYQGALWWSPDGTTWTRDTLSGANPTYNPVDMRAIRIDDHTVVAAQTIAGSTVEWASTDGKTWTRLKGNPVYSWASIGESRGDLIAGWDRGMIQNGSTLSVFSDKLALVTLKQTGDLPWWDEYPQLALGPSGLLACDGGTRFWIGVPTAG